MTTNIVHPFSSAKADGPDATLVRPSNWNAGHNPFLSMTNRSGAAVVQYDACAVGTANDDSFTTTTTQRDTRPLVVVQAAAGIANNAAGTVQNLFESTVNVQGNVTRGNYLQFSATAGRLEDSGVAATSEPPPGACAVAVTGYAGGGAGTVTAYLLGVTLGRAKALLFGGAAEDSIGAGQTRYTGPGDATALEGTESNCLNVPLPAGTLTNLRVWHNTDIGGVTTVVHTVRLNGVDTALAVTISGGSQTGGPDTDRVAVTADQRITLSHVASAGIVATRFSWSVELIIS